MAVVRCENGHYYDSEKFSRCPHCGIFRPSDSGKTVAMQPEEKSAGEKPGRFSGLRGFFRKEDRTEDKPEDSSKHKPMEKTISIRAAEEPEVKDDQRTIGLHSSVRGTEYVTGWLVCVKGPEKGRDYRLTHGFNRVGRGSSMAVNIADDPSISRVNQCAIAYDDRSNRFYLTPTDGNIVRKNEEMLTEPVLLETGDLIQIGASEFEFVAFCRGDRKWEEESST